MDYALDLTRRHFVHRRGNITAIGTWIRLTEGAGLRPCLALIRTGDRSADIVPCVITMDHIWRWSDAIGDPAWAARQSVDIAKTLRLGDDFRTHIQICLLVNDLIGDVLAIPPLVLGRGPVVAEGVLTDNIAGTSRLFEMRHQG